MLKKMVLNIFLLIQIVLFPKNATATLSEKNNVNTRDEIKEYILHHLKDSHDFNLFSYTDDEEKKIHVGFPLPVILWDDGLKIFSSSRLHHGESIAKIGNNYYKLYHSKIYKTNSEGEIEYDESSHPKNIAPLDFSLTKGVVSIIFTSLLMFFLFKGLADSYKKNKMVANGIGRFFEPIVLYVRDEIAIPNIGEKYYKNYMSYLLTLFFFIWFLNMLGLTPLGINVTGNIAVTFCLALITFLITNLTAKKDYWMHIFWMPGVPWPMRIALAPIELLGVIIKPFALMIRLYANISAGHIVLMSLIALIFIFRNWLGSSLSFILAFSISSSTSFWFV